MGKYQLVLKCRSCKHRYKRIVEAEDEEELKALPNPPCPKCAKKPHRTDSYQTGSSPIPHDGINSIVETQRAPGIVGSNIAVRAIDKTAEIVMEDYKLTNLRDDVRQGEAMAPRLPGPQQKAADEFFGGAKPGTANKAQQARMQRMLRKAVGGAYRNAAVDIKSILPDNRVALRRSGIEQV